MTVPGESRRRPSRRQLIIGAAGLTAVLGAGVSVAVGQNADREETTAAREVGPLAPTTVPTSASPSVTESVSASPSVSTSSASASHSVVVTSAAGRPSSPAVRRSPVDEKKVRREVDEARAKASKDGVPLQRPLTAQGQVTVPVSTITENTSGGTVRITTARGDLTGQPAQLMAADEGQAVGENARCTKKMRFSANGPVRTMPGALLCWRTSSERSVVTFAVSRKGKPATATSVAIIEREWAKLG